MREMRDNSGDPVDGEQAGLSTMLPYVMRRCVTGSVESHVYYCVICYQVFLSNANHTIDVGIVRPTRLPELLAIESQKS
jgi:hypothetical protein